MWLFALSSVIWFNFAFGSQSPSDYAWTDGTPMDYTNWWAGTIFNRHPYAPECNGLGTAQQSSWNDNSWRCRPYDSAQAFVCDDPTGTGYVVVNQTETFAGWGYVLVNQAKTFGEAESYCQSTYGTHLASIHSASENQQLKDLMVSSGADWAFIGIYLPCK